MRRFAPVLLLFLGECLDPTEVKLVLDTDVPCTQIPPNGIKIYISGANELSVDRPETAVVQCKGSNLGMLVLVPSPRRDKIGIVVTAATAPDADCTKAANYKHCIVGRRIVSFIDHTPLTLPISLQSSCIDRPCMPSETCVNGACVNAAVDPSACAKPGGCVLGPDGGVDSGKEAGGPRAVRSVTAGIGTTCASLSDDSTWCWGDNTNGQLALQPTGIDANNMPRQTLFKGSGPLGLSIAGGFGCGVDLMGIVACWGAQGEGSLGDGLASTPKNAIRASPKEVASSAMASSLAVGGSHGCFVSSGSVECWGWASMPAPIGRGMTPSQADIPQPLGGVAMATVSAGSNFTCAIGAMDGHVYCWGQNSYSQLGTNDTTARYTPTLFGGPVSAFDVVSAGNLHACAAKTGTTQIVCWGANPLGQCGVAMPGVLPAPVPVQVPNVIKAISAGGNHTCAIVGNGEVVCWGSQQFGQLGNGVSNANGTAAIQSTGLTNMIGVAAGNTHTCAWNAQQIYCWGNNANGELGNGKTDAGSTKPILVAGLP